MSILVLCYVTLLETWTPWEPTGYLAVLWVTASRSPWLTLRTSPRLPLLWSHVWAVTHTHTHKHKKTGIQYPNKDGRANKRREREHWQCWAALTNLKREIVWGHNVPYASLLRPLPKPLTALLPDQLYILPSANPPMPLSFWLSLCWGMVVSVQGLSPWPCIDSWWKVCVEMLWSEHGVDRKP